MKASVTIILLTFSVGCTGSISEAPGEIQPVRDNPDVQDKSKAQTPTADKSLAPQDRTLPPSVALPGGRVDRCTAVRPGASPLRRLTRFEYDRTVFDLFQDSTGPAAGFPVEEAPYGYDNAAEAFGTSPLSADGYFSAAEQIAARAMRIPTLGACDIAKTTEAACARTFVVQVGRRVFRRPLTDLELGRYLAGFSTFRTKHDYRTSVEMVLHAMLASPNFIYRLELTRTQDPATGAIALGSHEIASRLSYLIWASMPDDELFRAADSGHLSTAADVKTQVQRMTAAPRARSAFNHFVAQWLGVDRLDLAEKDAKLFPTFTPEVRSLLKAERERLTDEIMERGDGRLATLLTMPQTFMNATLAKFYNVKGPRGEAFEAVALDPGQRGGVLTQAGLLAVHAKPNQSSPVARGKFIRQGLFCTDPPPPPNDIVIVPPDLSPTLTTRERYSQHSANPACSGCHKLMDPIGLGLETYNAVGQVRTTENGRPINATGTLVATDVDGDFDGAGQLAGKLSTSNQVHSCVALQWFRYAAGRLERDEDQCALSALKATFANSKGDLRTLATAFADTDTFRFTRLATDERM